MVVYNHVSMLNSPCTHKNCYRTSLYLQLISVYMTRTWHHPYEDNTVHCSQHPENMCKDKCLYTAHFCEIFHQVSK